MATTVADEVSALTRIFSSSPPKLERTKWRALVVIPAKNMNAYIAIQGAVAGQFQPRLENSYRRSQSHIRLGPNSFRNLHSTVLAFQQFHSRRLNPLLILKSMLDPSELSINVTGSVYKRPCAGTGRRRSSISTPSDLVARKR